MVRIKVLIVIALAAVMVLGLATTTCCDGADGNGDISNGNSNGHVPNEGEPDLISGPGIIIDCEEYSGSGFEEVEPAPDFQFQDANGQTFSLSDFQGKSVMLNFWATWCGYCVLELPYLEQVHDEWIDEDLAILAIDLGESADKVNAYLAEIDISLPVVLDMEALVASQYRVSTIPRTFFIDKEGLIRGVKVGAFSSKEEIEDILNQLIALQGG